jgi:hypothetical protein
MPRPSAAPTPESSGWVRVPADSDLEPVVSQATEIANVRAAELIRLVLQGRHSEAEALLGTVPTDDLYALATVAVVHAAHAYREGMGVLPALVHLHHLSKET